jgi:hypothetical protein
MATLDQALKSKTVLFGGLLAIASGVQTLVPFLPANLVGPVGTLVGAAVVLLRFVTSVPLSKK